MSILDDARKSRHAGLTAMRDKLAASMDAAEPSVVAQIAGRLQAVLKELDELGDNSGGSEVDEIAARRIAKTGDLSSSGRRRNIRRG